jgi:NifU-like protein involved in Fe-S cluster formation
VELVHAGEGPLEVRDARGQLSLPQGPVPEGIGKLAVFSGVCEFPSRVKCASLAWHTLRAAMEGKDETISTEAEEAGDDPKQQRK